MQGWNNGIGCVSWDNMMEDMATLEISRAQTWQWLHHKIELDKGNTVTKALVGKVFEEELEKINQEIKDLNLVKKQEVTLLQEFDAAAKKAEQIFTMDELPDFLNEAEAAIQG
jgi:malate synthase